MISHVVLMKPRGDLTDAARDALIAVFTRATRDIPTIRRVSVGRRVRHGAGYEAAAPDAADYLVVIDFDTLDDLQAYLRHPAHEDLGARFNDSLSAAMVYDFEVAGIDALRAGGLFQS
jgi:Stress responsive A/B Barrel Domain